MPMSEDRLHSDVPSVQNGRARRDDPAVLLLDLGERRLSACGIRPPNPEASRFRIRLGPTRRPTLEHVNIHSNSIFLTHRGRCTEDDSVFEAAIRSFSPFDPDIVVIHPSKAERNRNPPDWNAFLRDLTAAFVLSGPDGGSIRMGLLHEMDRRNPVFERRSRIPAQWGPDALDSTLRRAEAVWAGFRRANEEWLNGVVFLTLMFSVPSGGSAHERIEALAHLHRRGFDPLL